MSTSGNRRLTCVLLAGCLVAGLAGCGSSSSARASSSGNSGALTVPSTAEAATTTPPTTVPAVSYTHTWTIEGESGPGATWKASFLTGSLVSGSQLSQVSSQLLSECDVNPQTDAVVPFLLNVTSTTNSFTTDLDVTLAVANRALNNMDSGVAIDPLGSGEGVAVAENYSGSQCDQLAGYDGATSSVPQFGLSLSDASVNATTGAEGIIVLSGWASPAHPSGDPNFLSNIWIEVPEDSDATGVSGPAVVDLPTPTLGWFFPLSGSGTPDCSNPGLSNADCSGG